MLYGLHGFLGEEGDWKHFNCSLGRVVPFWEWAAEFNQGVEPGSMLMGYSLGGRLALHALVEAPHLYKAAVILSAHPGMSDPSERWERRSADEKWAERFLFQDWGAVMDRWNRQPAFEGREAPERREENYSRTQLAQMLMVWSLGRQDDLREKIRKLDIPILWMVGQEDQKFLKAVPPLSHSRSQICIVPNAAHRLMWEEPKFVEERIKEFIGEVT